MDSTTFWSFGSNVFTGGLITFCLHVVMALLIAWIIARIISRSTRRYAKQTGRQMQMMYLDRIAKVIIYGMALFSILDQIKALQGIGTAALGATSVISVIIGLAAQETFGNFIAGVALSLSMPYKVGDQITLPEQEITGTVTKMTFRQTELLTMQNTKLIIPNSTMNTAIIEDRAYGQEIYQRSITFTVGYDTDVDELRKIILKELAGEPLVIDTRTDEEKEEGKPQVLIRIDDFLDSGIQVCFPLITASIGDNFRAASNIRVALLKDFREAGIEIPYNKVEIVGDRKTD